jgi:endopolyphosphatase
MWDAKPTKFMGEKSEFDDGMIISINNVSESEFDKKKTTMLSLSKQNILKLVFYTLLFFTVLSNYFQLKKLIYSSENVQFHAIIDKDDTIEHLKSLHLTPNRSVKILSTDINGLKKEKLLHGRFLHLTDMHPDELNVIGAAIRKKCHQKLKKINVNSDISHKFGDALSGCDAPIDLYQSTLQWIKENLKDHIDFVIWTGDNIRHDNDRENPRTEMDIFDMNERVANDISLTFMDDDEEDISPFDRRVRIIPSLGNNDVYPHNLFAPGPTLQTRELYKIWRNFVPPEQMHTFDRGAYFFREVIPGKMVVISINTLYWFQSNPLNDNCDSRKQPGYKLFLWLGATLKECRRRGLKVWLSGHVPPIPKNIHHSCYSKISVWMHEYRDLIIGGVWGHMNIDHWVPLDSVKAWRSIEKRLLSLGALNENESIRYINYDELNLFLEEFDDESDASENFENDDFENVEELYSSLGFDIDDQTNFPLHTFSDRYLGAPNGKVSYLEDLRDTMYSKLKGRKKSGQFHERYAIAHISASVIPTFNPGMRVWEYNITEFQNLDNNNSDNNKVGGIKELYYNIWSYLTKSNQLYSFKEQNWNEFFIELENELDDESQIERLVTEMENDADQINSKEYLELLKPGKDKTLPNLMPKDLPLGPAYIPQSFTPEKYVQYYIDLNKVNYELSNIEDWDFKYDFHYSTEDYSDTLLVGDWIRLGRKFAAAAKPSKPKNVQLNIDNDDSMVQTEKLKKLWDNYIDRAFVSSDYQKLEDAY